LATVVLLDLGRLTNKMVVNDLDWQMTFAYVMNKMGMSSPGG
jgi:hypothetical protein